MSACFGKNELEGLKGSKMWAGYGLSNVTGFWRAIRFDAQVKHYYSVRHFSRVTCLANTNTNTSVTLMNANPKADD